MAEQETGHPLDRQNAIERDIQLKGALDPDNFEMPDGRTLTEVRTSLQERQDEEYQKEVRMVASRTREQSIQGFQKTGEKLVMTPTGSIVDVTEPVPSEETITLAESRTTMADIEGGAIQPLRERGDIPVNTGSAPSPGTSPSATAPTSTSGTGTVAAPSISPAPPTASSPSTGSISPGGTVSGK